MSARIAVVGLPFFAERAARGLREIGYRATYLHRPGRTPGAWVVFAASLLSADLVYAIGSSVVRNSPADLLARARRRILLHWVGTDVQVARTDHEAGRTSGRLLRHAAHWVDAPWLAEELAPLGVAAACHPLPIATAIGDVAPLPPEFRVLVYLPRRPHESYDVDATMAVIQALPGVRFTIVGGFTPPAPLPNVDVVGYVDDMPAAYRQTAALLRLTRHDGLSHSVIEALSFGRYVVWSYPFAGATRAESAEAAISAIRELQARFAAGSLGPNEEGAAAVTQQYRWCTIAGEIRAGIDQLLS